MHTNLTQEKIDNAIEFVKSKHNGELLYKIDPQQYGKLMVLYAEEAAKKAWQEGVDQLSLLISGRDVVGELSNPYGK